jgi:hypothetical protein
MGGNLAILTMRSHSAAPGSSPHRSHPRGRRNVPCRRGRRRRPTAIVRTQIGRKVRAAASSLFQEQPALRAPLPCTLSTNRGRRSTAHIFAGLQNQNSPIPRRPAKVPTFSTQPRCWSALRSIAAEQDTTGKRATQRRIRGEPMARRTAIAFCVVMVASVEPHAEPFAGLPRQYVLPLPIQCK